MVPFLQPDDEIDDTARARQFVEWAIQFLKTETR
jgi:hypothetical protein